MSSNGPMLLQRQGKELFMGYVKHAACKEACTPAYHPGFFTCRIRVEDILFMIPTARITAIKFSSPYRLTKSDFFPISAFISRYKCRADYRRDGVTKKRERKRTTLMNKSGQQGRLQSYPIDFYHSSRYRIQGTN